MNYPMFKFRRKYHHLCGDCIYFDTCKKLTVKNVRYDTDSCQYYDDRFTPKKKD